MYRTKPLFDYIHEGEYAILPPGLPDRFYPEEADMAYFTEAYVICFNKNITNDIKQRFIKDYAEYYAKEKELGYYR